MTRFNVWREIVNLVSTGTFAGLSLHNGTTQRETKNIAKNTRTTWRNNPPLITNYGQSTYTPPKSPLRNKGSIPIGSMYLVYSPTWKPWKSISHVGKYIVHFRARGVFLNIPFHESLCEKTLMTPIRPRKEEEPVTIASASKVILPSHLETPSSRTQKKH